MVYSKNKTKELIFEFSSKLSIPTVVENKYTGTYTFPIEHSTLCNDTDHVIQRYSDNTCIKITDGKTSSILLSDIGSIDLTKKRLYGFYTICLYEHYIYYLQKKSIEELINKILVNSRSKSFYLITKNRGIVTTPVTDENTTDIDYEFYASFFFWYVTLCMR